MDMAVDQSGQNGVPGQVKDRILGPRLGQDTLVHFSHILHHVLIEFVLYIVKDIEPFSMAGAPVPSTMRTFFR